MLGHLHEQLRVLADLLVQLRQLAVCHWPTGLLLCRQLIVLAAQPGLSHLRHPQKHKIMRYYSVVYITLLMT